MICSTWFISFKKTIQIVGIFGMALLTGCSNNQIISEVEVYFNDFESNDYTGISGVWISDFNRSKVMGNFNNKGFQLSLPNIPDHNYIVVEFDLYIHDSWDGNSNELNPPGTDHDAWIMEFDPDENIKASERILFETTFSNGLCIPGFCHSQSYPQGFPFPNEARQDATSSNLPGRCLWKTSPNGSSMYKIVKMFLHNRSKSVIHFYDRLIQPDSFNPECDESWSLDNLKVTALTIN